MDILSTQPTIGNTLFEFVLLVLVQKTATSEFRFIFKW